MEDSKYYNYPIKKVLIKDILDIDNLNTYHHVKLCIYTINTSCKYPFLRFVLCNNGFNNLTLPNLPISNSIEKHNLERYSKVFLSTILQIYDFEEFNRKIIFDGFYECDSELYLFYDITTLFDDLNIDETYLSNTVRFALTDEIVNHKHICNIPIKDETSDFFINNSSINYLYNENNEPYEIPVVGYVGKQTPEKINFVFTFGEIAKNKSAILGPYFYFTDFYNAINQGNSSQDNEHGRSNKGGIIRFALFVGKTKYIENMPNDPNDMSDIKKDRLNDKNLNNKYEILTLRISDHDGLWSKIYDSVYLGNIELDDGSYLEEPQTLVIKDYKQQMPLSYHFIDKNKFNDKINGKVNGKFSKYNYSIM